MAANHTNRSYISTVEYRTKSLGVDLSVAIGLGRGSRGAEEDPLAVAVNRDYRDVSACGVRCSSWGHSQH